MSKLTKESSIKELQRIPGVGKKIAEELWELGICSTQDLKDKDPERLYKRLSIKKCMPIDRCMLYVFRCAVYFSSNSRHNPQLLKWWNWKDKK